MTKPKTTNKKLKAAPQTAAARIEVVSLATLHNDAHNVNKHTQKGQRLVEQSIRQRGIGRPGFAARNAAGEIVMLGGNLSSLEVPAGIGLDEAVLVFTDGKRPIVHVRQDLDADSDEARLMALEDNVAGVASYDPDIAELANLTEIEGFDLIISEKEYRRLVANAILEDEDAEPPDNGADPKTTQAQELAKTWGIATGQVWELGNHRVMCGDATNAGDVAALMQTDKARLLVTSPPYTDQRTYNLGKFNWLALANGFFLAALPHMDTACDIAVNLGLSHKSGKVDQYWQPWLIECERQGWPLFGWYVWDKGAGMPGEWNGRLATAHEFVFHFHRGKNSANKWIATTGESEKRGSGGRRFRETNGTLKKLTSPDSIGQAYKVPDSVIRVNRDYTRGIHTQNHPAVFSVDFAAYLIKSWGAASSIVYEPFAGSGTTVIACEQSGHKCRAMEIDKGYTAVTLQRWADTTGNTPALIRG